MVTGGDPLGELAEVAAGEQVAEFRLPYEDDLQQLLFVGLEIREQPQLLQDVDTEVLGLFDDENGPAAAGVGVEQGIVDEVDKHLHARFALAVGDPEFVADRGKKLGDRQFRIEEEGDISIPGDLFQQEAAEGGLPRAHITSQQDEAAVAPDAVQEMGEGLLVTPAHVEVAGVRRY